MNGIAVTAAAIGAEAQNHPAGSAEDALAAAARALLVRELLVQRAREIGIDPAPKSDSLGREETEEDALVRQVVGKEVSVPDVGDNACRLYFERRGQDFQSPALFEASHILFSAAREDREAYDTAVCRAEDAIKRISAAPESFARLARQLSDCQSGREGGSLGQVSRGETVPEVETFLESLEIGQLCPVPVKSRFGVHVLRLDNRIEGEQLPYEAVRVEIARKIQRAAWKKSIVFYLRQLAERADIKGVEAGALLGGHEGRS